MAESVHSSSEEEEISWSAILSKTSPTVLKNKLTKWQCNNWSIADWASHCSDILFKFRCDSKTSLTQWEAQNAYANATLEDLISWLHIPNKNLPGEHPLRKFDSKTSWCYSSYNYMAEVFKNDPSMLDIVDWSSFGLPNRGGYDSTLWIGTGGSYTPCHQDSYGSNLVAQLIGEKLWVLYPPESSQFLYPTRIPYEESSIFSSVNILSPDTNAYPDFCKTNPHIVVLEPGDVLYVPPKWWHFVYCLDTAVTINTWVEHELDDLWRLEESVSRFLMTALMPTYNNTNWAWLNPTEELVSGHETAKLLQIMCKRLKSKKQMSNKADIDTIANAGCVTSVSFERFEEEMISRTNYERCSASGARNEVVDIVNCFLSDNVVKAISDNLLRLHME